MRKLFKCMIKPYNWILKIQMLTIIKVVNIYNIGISLYNLKRYEEAIQMYDKAIQLNPQDSDFYNNKGLK